MKLIEINEAEAIIEPFYDGGTSEPDNHDLRYRVLDEYEIRALNGAVANVKQAWAFIRLSVERTVPDLPVLELRRSCELDIQDYDTFIFFGSLPKGFRLTVQAVIDGVEITLLKDVPGAGVNEEFTAPVQGKRLEGLCIRIASLSDGIEGTITWLGLAHSGRLSRMLARKPHYSSDWPGCFVEQAPENPQPMLGILMDGEELQALREKLRTPPFCEVYRKKKEQAQRDMAICPESYIGRFVPHYDQRWCRTRDRAWAPSLTENACGLETAIENLAFVGIVENNLDMMRMAARHALAVAHCEYWCESAMGILPGATWHHRSFTENIYCKVMSLVLDWCGQLLTPFAHQILRDALAMKGLPRIESDFRRIEYIRYMNQGIVFSYGRIFADLALLARHPRYERDLLHAEEDLHEMISNYIQADGGTLEGPGYWMFTFNESMCALYAMARYHKKPFTCYRELLGSTGEFELSMLAMDENETVLHAVNDAHPATAVSCALANSFYLFTGQPAWKNLYERLLAGGHVDKDTFALISSPLPDGRILPEPQPVNRIFPVTGQLGAMRTGKDMRTCFHLCSGPTYATHFHADKGSLLLDADGRTLCPDCGSANYFESELYYLHHARSHSLLHPVRESGALSVQGRYDEGGRVLKAEQNGQWVEFITDDTRAWSDGVYELDQRRLISPAAEFAVIEDTFALGQADHVEFLLNCFGELQLENGRAYARMGDVTLRVIPLNWKWENASVRTLQDGEHRPVWQLCAPYTAARAGRLLTLVCVEKNCAVQLEETSDGWMLRHGEDAYTLRAGEQQAQLERV